MEKYPIDAEVLRVRLEEWPNTTTCRSSSQHKPVREKNAQDQEPHRPWGKSGRRSVEQNAEGGHGF